MILEFYHLILDFLKESVELVALCLAVAQLLKLTIKDKPFYKEWMGIAIAGLVSLALALPPSLEVFEIEPYAAASLGLFGMATGIYKLLREMIDSISV